MTYTYPAIYTRQRQGDWPLFATFAAPAGEIAQWATISRLKHDGSGHQRLRSESRVRAITRYMEQDDRNTIPSALVVALNLPNITEPENDGCAAIEIPADSDNPPGLVIDGQHRLFGISDFDENTLLNVVALINVPDDEIAFQFLVINGKSSKVPTNHVKLLALQYEHDELANRLTTARMTLGKYSLVGVVDGSPDSPFYRSVTWPTEASPADEGRTSLVLPGAIEQALAAISQKRLPELENDDALLEFFFTLWSSIRELWPELWNAESKLLQKVGIVSMTMFVIEDLVPLADRGDIDLSSPTEVRAEIEDNIFGYLLPDFWQHDWTARSLDTSAGRQLVVDALKQVRRNLRRNIKWNTEVGLVNVD